MISNKFTPRKILLYVAILSIVVFTNACSPSKVDDNSSPDALAKTLVYAIKTNDQELFAKHLATPEHRYAFNDRPGALWKSVKTEEQFKSELQTGYEEILQKTLSTLRSEFSQLGLTDWSDVEFFRYSYEMRNSNDYTLYGQVIFVTEEMAGSLTRVEFYKASDGWKIYTVPKADEYVSRAYLR